LGFFSFRRDDSNAVIAYFYIMKVLLDIKDNKAKFVLELLANLTYVKTHKITPIKAQMIEEFKEAIEELKLVKAGKKKAKNAEDFLNEL
jgi:hypothetical protein